MPLESIALRTLPAAMVCYYWCLGLWDTCPERTPSDKRPRPEGRCRTSLGGGSRGERQRRCSGRKRYGDLGSGLMTKTGRQAAPVCHCVWVGPGATVVLHPSLGAACVLDRHFQRRACTNPADGPKRVDIQDKWWFRGLFMMEVAPEWPARSSNFAR